MFQTQITLSAFYGLFAALSRGMCIVAVFTAVDNEVVASEKQGYAPDTCKCNNGVDYTAEK